jgi:hypothetical protein
MNRDLLDDLTTEENRIKKFKSMITKLYEINRILNTRSKYEKSKI